MPMNVPCANCRQMLAVPDHLVGKQVACPKCKATVTVPAIQAPPVAPPAFQPPLVPPPAYQPPPLLGQVPRPETFQSLFQWARWMFYGLAGVFGLFLIGLLVMLLGVIVAGVSANPNAPGNAGGSAGGLLFLIGYGVMMVSLFLWMIPGIGHAVVWFIILYKCWELIQDGQHQTTPGQAVGFLFIPFFNLYWIFIAIRGLADDLNAYAEQRGLNPQANVGLATTHCILILCGILPCVNVLIIPANLVVQFLLAKSFCLAAADIAGSKLGQPPSLSL